MSYLLKILLESDKPVYRDVLISKSNTLFELHEAIIAAFHFKGDQMASFYEIDEHQDQVSEIPLLDIDPEFTNKLMSDFKISDFIQKEGHEMQYVYDYLNNWRFFIECVEIREESAGLKKPKLIKSYGPSPIELDVNGKDAEQILMDALLGDELSIDDDYDEDDMEDEYSDDEDYGSYEDDDY